MNEEVKQHLTKARNLLIAGWLVLPPIWYFVYGAIGEVDRLTGWVAGNWILIVPALITVMMVGMTIAYFKARKKGKSSRW